jgi:ATP-dependent helicase/nuclease subunit A
MSNLTPKQRLGLARDKNIALNAGAGTGKTRILVERYLEILVEENLDVKNVLAITFTNKAAAEVMVRVAQNIEEKLLVTKKEGIHRKLLNIRNRLSSANIATIHAFCMRILRDYPLESGLDPEFSLLNELQSNLMIEETIKEEIETLNQEENNWLGLFRMFGQKTINEMLQFALEHRFEMERINKYASEVSIDDQ